MRKYAEEKLDNSGKELFNHRNRILQDGFNAIKKTGYNSFCSFNNPMKLTVCFLVKPIKKA